MTQADRSIGQALRIGEIAAQTGVSVEALRYYERRDLLRPTARSASGYRVFGSDAIRVVRFIKRAQSLGFSLSEIEELVRLRESAWSGDAPRELRDAAVAKVRDIDRRVRELKALGRELTDLIGACDAACPAGDESVRAGPELASDGSLDVLACPLIEAFDAVSDPDEDSPTAVADRSSERAKASRSTNGPPTPGRRNSPRQQSPAHARSSGPRRPS